MNILQKAQDNALLPILLKRQQENAFNFLSEEDVNSIATELKLSRSRVYSTASFYSEISLKPRGRHIIRLCCNAPCENAGREAIREAVTGELGIEADETTEDRQFTLESVNCLGACYMSPAMRIDDEIYGNLTAEEAIRIVKSYMEDEK